MKVFWLLLLAALQNQNENTALWLLFLAAIGITAVAAFCCGRTALRAFGGISGDLAGWFLVKEEFWLLAALTAVQLGGRGL